MIIIISGGIKKFATNYYNNIMNTKYILIGGVIAVIAGAGVYTVMRGDVATTPTEQAVADKTPDITTNEPVVVSETIKTTELNKVADGESPQLAVMHMEFPPEVDSVGGLLKISSNVFIGKVLKKNGDGTGHQRPSTRFEVEVVENITGNITGKVFVDQIGVGLSAKNGKFYVTEGDVPNITSGKFNPNDVYLKTGATYLFASYCEENRCGISAPPYDRTLITTNVGLTKTQIMTATHANARVQQFFDLANK
jgi:hypothetical protein